MVVTQVRVKSAPRSSGEQAQLRVVAPAGKAAAGKSSPGAVTPNPLEVDQDGVYVLDAAGDLVLSFTDKKRSPTDILFRVLATKLSAASPYFRLLLDPNGFEEGRRIAAAHEDLRGRDLKQVPSADLPRATIEDIGRISPVKSLHLLLADFLRILHGQELAVPPPTTNLANLVVVADRFDALAVLERHITSKSIPELIDVKIARAKTQTLSEERLRQRCYIGIKLSYAPWLASASQALLQHCSFRTTASEEQPAWTDLPSGIEEELLYRRTYILDTLQSLQTWLLGRYTSRSRQCEMYYDSSAACDSFQLGEMVRFFTRIGTLSLAGRLTDMDDTRDDCYQGAIGDLISKLKQCTEYQVDGNHHHCGLRTRLMPLLSVVEHALEECTICLECWTERRADYAWSEANRPLVWDRERNRQDTDRGPHGKHLQIRDMCMAQERLWEITPIGE